MATFQEIASAPFIEGLAAATVLPDLAQELSDLGEKSLRNPSEYQGQVLDVSSELVECGDKYSEEKHRRFSEVLSGWALHKTHMDTLLSIQGDDAVKPLEAMQLWLDYAPSDHKFRRSVIYLLIKLASASGRFPESLFVSGVELDPNQDVIYGGCSDIYKATYRTALHAVKRLRPSVKAEFNKMLCKEALVWRQLNHPYVLKFVGIDRTTFGRPDVLCMISPWMSNGTIMNFIKSEQYKPTRDRHRLIREAAEGLTYLHSMKIVHADLKAVNVFVGEDHHVRIGDFGLALIGDSTVGRMTTPSSFRGTLEWMAPEHLDDPNLRPALPLDVYAFACLCYSICTGKTPWQDVSLRGAFALKVVQGHRPARPTNDACIDGMDVSDELWTLIERCWSGKVDARPRMVEVLTTLEGWDMERDNPDEPFPAENASPSNTTPSLETDGVLSQPQSVSELTLDTPEPPRHLELPPALGIIASDARETEKPATPQRTSAPEHQEQPTMIGALSGLPELMSHWQQPGTVEAYIASEGEEIHHPTTDDVVEDFNDKDAGKARWKAHAKQCEAMMHSSGIVPPPRSPQMTPSPTDARQLFWA